MGLFSKFFDKIKSVTTSGLASQDWEELELALIESDLGAANSKELIEIAKEILKKDKTDPSAAILAALRGWLSTSSRALIEKDGLRTIAIVGVNGTGKTTSVAKLANYLNQENRKVLLAAGDTFRAAAIAQLKNWGVQLNLEVITPPEHVTNGDPAAVAFDGAKKAVQENYQDYLIDTAGRLHTKNNLMEELSKVIRVVSKLTPVDEILLVVDATTGQNGIAQAKTFANSTALTGLILTKLDGSAKGGIALAIERELGLPIKFVGTGESIQDFQAFDGEKYLAGLIN
jgi:fused signal recognition particle receptor